MTLAEKVRTYLGRTPDPITECHIRQNVDGTQDILFWSASLPKRPTAEELDKIVVEPVVEDVPQEAVALSEFIALRNRVALLETLLLEKPANG
jgi:hypothetical protein